MKLNRYDIKSQKLFNVIVNGVQLLTNGTDAVEAIAHALTWVEEEGVTGFKDSFFTRERKCKCNCGCEDGDEDEDACTCAKDDKKVKRIPTLITNVIFNDGHMNLAYFDAVHIVQPAPAKAKRGRPATKK